MTDPAQAQVQVGDLVLVQRARVFVAFVTQMTARELVLQPCDAAVPDRRARLEDVRQVYRPVGRPAQAPRRLRPSPRQLSLAEAGRGR